MEGGVGAAVGDAAGLDRGERRNSLSSPKSRSSSNSFRLFLFLFTGGEGGVGVGVCGGVVGGGGAGGGGGGGGTLMPDVVLFWSTVAVAVGSRWRRLR